MKHPEPSDNQLAYLYMTLGYKGAPPRTALRASRLIEQLKEQDPPTERQLELLDKLGYRGREPDSKSHASDIIGRLLDK